MTTILAIKTNFGLEAIVLAADRQLTTTDEDEKQVSRRLVKKLHYSDEWVMGCAGIYRREVPQFFGELKGYKNYGSSPEKAREIIEGAIKNKDFSRVTELNKKLKKENVALGDLLSFVLATKKPKLEFWLIDEYGNFHNPNEDSEFDYICLGSGKEDADKRISELIESQRIDREKISITIALNIEKEVMHAAEKDPGTGLGYDLVVITEADIKSWGEDIKEEIKRAEERKIQDIAKHYESREKDKQ